MTGTSMAAPHAAGLAALHIAANPRPTGADADWVYGVRRALIDTGNPWRSPLGLMSPAAGPNEDSPDKYEETVGWARNTTVTLPPAVTISAPVDGAELRDVVKVKVQVTATAFEGRTVKHVEFFVGDTYIGIDDNGGDGWSIDWNTTATDENNNLLYPDGSYTIAAVATDSAGKTGSDSILVHLDNVDDLPAGTMIAQLSGSAQSVNRNFWQALVTVTVVDAGSNGLPGATVSGIWSTNSAASGTTGADGAVTFSSGNLRTNLSSVTFTLTNVVLADYDYVPGADSITVSSDGTTTVNAIRLDNDLTVVSEALTKLVLDAGVAPANVIAGGSSIATDTVPEGSGASDSNDLREQHTAAVANGYGSAASARVATASSKRFADDQPQDDSVVSSLDASAVDQLLAIGW